MGNVYIVLATVLWGLWGFACKEAQRRVNVWSVQWMSLMPPFLGIPLGWAFLRTQVLPQGISPIAMLWSLTAGAASLAGSVLLLLSMQTRPATVAIAATAAYPLVTLLLTAATGVEALRVSHAIGAVLVVSGLAVLYAF